MSFPQYQPECLDADRLLELKEKYGIYFTVHIDESLDPVCVNAGVAQAYLDTMLKTVALAKKAGIPVLNMHLQRGVYVTLPERRTYIYAENQDFYLGKMREFRDRITGDRQQRRDGLRREYRRGRLLRAALPRRRG